MTILHKNFITGSMHQQGFGPYSSDYSPGDVPASAVLVAASITIYHNGTTGSQIGDRHGELPLTSSNIGGNTWESNENGLVVDWTLPLNQPYNGVTSYTLQVHDMRPLGVSSAVSWDGWFYYDTAYDPANYPQPPVPEPEEAPTGLNPGEGEQLLDGLPDLYAGLLFSDPFAVQDPLSVELTHQTYSRQPVEATREGLVLTLTEELFWPGLPPGTVVMAVGLFDAPINGNLRFAAVHASPRLLKDGGSYTVSGLRYGLQ